MNFLVYPTEAVNMSGRRLSQMFFDEGYANGNKTSNVVTSNGVQQPAKTPTASNFSVNTTEDCNEFINGKISAEDFK